MTVPGVVTVSTGGSRAWKIWARNGSPVTVRVAGSVWDAYGASGLLLGPVGGAGVSVADREGTTIQGQCGPLAFTCLPEG